MRVTIDIDSESIVAETEGLALALRNLLDKATFFMEISKFPMDWKHSAHMTPLIGKAG